MSYKKCMFCKKEDPKWAPLDLCNHQSSFYAKKTWFTTSTTII
jgi:hypothetical protein